MIDTNVLLRHLLSRTQASSSSQVVRLWLQAKKLQLVVSLELEQEYLAEMARVAGYKEKQLSTWEARFRDTHRCTRIRLGPRYTASRDPKDNFLLALARTGNVAFLITHDKDLLQLPAAFRRSLPFEIVTPREFLGRFKA